MPDIITTLVPPAQITTALQPPQPIATTLTAGQGPSGPQGAQGPPGAGGDLSLKYDVSVASNVWTIVHNLGKYPSVTTIDSSGTEYSGAISYPDVNTVVVEFAAGFSGSALLN